MKPEIFKFAVREGLLLILSIFLMSACASAPSERVPLPTGAPSAGEPREWGRYEADYMRTWCSDPAWRMEPTLFNRDEPDCLTGTHAVEIDWAWNWEKCFHQARRYAETTGLKSMCVLIFKKPSDRNYLDRLERKIAEEHIHLEVQTMTPEDL